MGSGSVKSCPECGEEMIRDSDREESVCSECGLVVNETETNWKDDEGESRGPDWRDSIPDKGVSVTPGSETEPPETVDEWRMWYPCPACDSTELKQIVESHLEVSATEDGGYGGESSMVEYEYVECANCEEVLLDEIGRS